MLLRTAWDSCCCQICQSTATAVGMILMQRRKKAAQRKTVSKNLATHQLTHHLRYSSGIQRRI